MFSSPLPKQTQANPSEKIAALRIQSQLKFKSTWDSIIEKYSQDFEGKTDVIDLETGKIVQDCGFMKNIEQMPFGGDEDVPPNENGAELESLRPFPKLLPEEAFEDSLSSSIPTKLKRPRPSTPLKEVRNQKCMSTGRIQRSYCIPNMHAIPSMPTIIRRAHPRIIRMPIASRIIAQPVRHVRPIHVIDNAPYRVYTQSPLRRVVYSPSPSSSKSPSSSISPRSSTAQSARSSGYESGYE